MFVWVLAESEGLLSRECFNHGDAQAGPPLFASICIGRYSRMVHKHLQSPGATLPTCSRDLETASLAALCGSPCSHRGCPVVSERSETRDVHEAAGLSV